MAAKDRNWKAAFGLSLPGTKTPYQVDLLLTWCVGLQDIFIPSP
jgi:hypothetical protein